MQMKARSSFLLIVLASVLVFAGCDDMTPGPPQPVATATPTLAQGVSTVVVAPTPIIVTPIVTVESDTPMPIGTPVGSDDSAQATAVTPAGSPAPGDTPTEPVGRVADCTPTREDAEGPFYVPGAPVRSKVGEGHVLTGVVRSSVDCSPLAGAQIEFWQVGPGGQYDDDHRATMFADESGRYRFESNFPPGYSGRPPHIHIKVSAEGFRQLTTQYYPQQGDTEGTFDLVLVPSDQ